MNPPNLDQIEKDAVELAARWQNRANVLLTGGTDTGMQILKNRLDVQLATEIGFYISRVPAVSMEGRIGLLQYLQEQAVCNNYHRYGNLGERGML